jgi:UDP-N-acetyl-D-glucosamine dehydrogenase
LPLRSTERKKPSRVQKSFFLGSPTNRTSTTSGNLQPLKIMDEVYKKGGEVFYHDPYIPEVKTEMGYTFKSSAYETISEVDCVVITTNHKDFEAEDILEKSRMVVDLRNVIKDPSDKVYKL